MSREMLSGIPSHLGLDGAVRAPGGGWAGGIFSPGLGMSGTAESPPELVKGPLTMTDGGPVRPRQLGKMECQGSAINNLAADRPRNVNGGVEQAGENVQFRQDGLFVCLKNTFFPPRRIKIEQQGDWVPKSWLLVQSETGAKAHKVKVWGQIPGKVSTRGAQKKPEPHL